MELSEKQKEVVKTVSLINPALVISSASRANAPASSGHSKTKNIAVDFKGTLPDLIDTYQKLIDQKYPGSIGLGILKAQKHLHVSNDARGMRFFEIARPDKNGFVRVVTIGDKNYNKYLEIAKSEYSEKKNSSLAFAIIPLIGFVGWKVFLDKKKPGR